MSLAAKPWPAPNGTYALVGFMVGSMSALLALLMI
jgi:hypothetical protein